MSKINRKDVDWRGKQFGQLTIVSSFYVPKPRGTKGFFKCICSCGKESTPRMDGVLSGVVISCGCYRSKANRTRFGYEPNEAIKNDMLKRYKAAAAKRKLQWLLTDEETLVLFKQNCYYCDQVPSTVHEKGSHFQGSFTYNGIDRADNEPYYSKQNVVTCCKQCNYAKRALTQIRFLGQVERIHAFHPSKYRDVDIAFFVKNKLSIINRLFTSRYKSRAKELSVAIDLSLETLIYLTQQDCYYCGEPPSNQISRYKHSYVYSGLDRLERSKGYVIENVVPCCHVCNLMKHIKDPSEFRAWIENIHNNNAKRNWK